MERIGYYFAGSMPLPRIAVLLALLAVLQAPSPPARGALIVGQVIDAASGRPAAGALVALGRATIPPGQIPRVLTGADGRFVFRDLDRGAYSILATKPGYAEGAYGRWRAGGPSTTLELAAGELLGDVTIRIWKHAAISGTIVDESGERQVGVEVRAYRRAVVAGHRRFLPVAVGRTDDRGIYRIANLLPGDYIVGTIARQNIVPLSVFRSNMQGDQMLLGELARSSQERGAVIPAGDVGIALGRGTLTPPPPIDGRLAIYPATFHPNAMAGDAAAVITVAPGEEFLTADLHLTPLPTARVSGTVVGPDGPVTRGLLRLHPAHTAEVFGEGDVPTALIDLAGHFTFPAVPSGHYIIRLARGGFSPTGNAPPLVWLEAPVSVGAEDVPALALTALPGLHVSGRLEFEGDTSRLRGLIAGVRVSIESADASASGAGPVYEARTNMAGDFTSPPIPGGRYYIRVANSPPDWMFKSATVDGRDAADTPVEISADLPNVVVTFTSRWSGVRGTVHGAAGRDSASALVIVFPTDRDTWGSSGFNPRRVRSTKPGRSGEYAFNLPAGDYYVIAIVDELSSEWQDPDFLDRASRFATRVTVAEGQRPTVDLRARDGR